MKYIKSIIILSFFLSHSIYVLGVGTNNHRTVVDKENTLEYANSYSEKFACPNVLDFTFEANCSGDKEVSFFMDTPHSLTNATIEWDFGDNTPISGVIDPVHTYAAYTTYSVTLTVDFDGTAGSCPPVSITKSVGVNDYVDYSLETETSCINTPASITPKAQALIPKFPATPPLSAVSAIWDFGDGTPTQNGPSHSYAAPGTYTITVTFTYSDGCTKTITQTIEIICCNNINFSIPNPTQCIETDMTFELNVNVDPAIVSWDFGDGTIVTGVLNPTHQYAAYGTYTVELTVDYGNGCTVIVPQTISLTEDKCCGEILGIQIGGNCQIANDLVVNGNFNLGNTGFTTNMTLTNNFPNPGEYIVTSDATSLTGYQAPLTYDHTIQGAASGNFLLSKLLDSQGGVQFVNEIWTQTYTVQPNTLYDLNFWITFYGPKGKERIITAIVEIEGDVVANSTLPNYKHIDWTGVNLTWNSGANTTAEIKIKFIDDDGDLITNNNTNVVVGLDDISFGVCESNYEFCNNELIDFSVLSDLPINGGFNADWDFGDGSPIVSSTNPQHAYEDAGTYQITLTISGTGLDGDCDYDLTFQETITINNCIDCEHCVGSFAPEKGKRYVLSAWVKEKDIINPTTQFKTYLGPEIVLNFPIAGMSSGPHKAKGKIIDGWQRIEEVFEVPATASEIVVKLNNSGLNEVFFDDIRIHPFDASMKSFVYDPITLRLVAELDENNYATFYEYDEEGKLIRVKKETERGIKTIQESRDHTVK